MEDIINDINKQLDRLHEREPALLFMDSAMAKLLLDSIKVIKLIEAQHREQTENLGLALRIYNLKSEYSKARFRSYRTIKNIVEQYNRSIFTGPMIPKEDFDYITTILYEFDDTEFKEGMKNQLHSINEKSPKLFKTMRDELSRVMHFYDELLLGGENILDGLIRDGKKLRELTVQTIREYCKTFYKPKLLKDLHHEAVRLMGGNKYSHVERENWVDLIANEDKIVELGKNGHALEEYLKSPAEDPRFEFYGEDRCKTLDNSTELMDIMLRVNYGLELFDLEGALNNYNLLSSLNESNQDLFCEMFLRRNVILGLIEPELKEEFEHWLGLPQDEHSEDAVQNKKNDYKDGKRNDCKDSLIRFVFDDNDRETVTIGLQACKDTRQVAAFARKLWEEEIVKYKELRSVDFHRAIIPLLKFDTTEIALKQAIAKQVKV